MGQTHKTISVGLLDSVGENSQFPVFDDFKFITTHWNQTKNLLYIIFGFVVREFDFSFYRADSPVTHRRVLGLSMSGVNHEGKTDVLRDFV